ncbi:hypothetical protein BG004_006717 [Podila humilis]|nr:hypothetical protein BG004_006717 [Podila humilis]
MFRLDELARLLAEQIPRNMNRPRVPFPDARRNAVRPDFVDPTVNHPSELLVDFDEVGTSPSAAPTLPEAESALQEITKVFNIDERIRDPYQMFYPTKRQKTDLPAAIAMARNCKSVISSNARVVSITGSTILDVSRCLQELQGMQEYFLRPRHILERVTLVYGSTREPFRIILVPLHRHQHFSKIPYFPTNISVFEGILPRDHLVAIKASYDPSEGDWLPDPEALFPLNLAPRPGRPRAPQSSSGQGSPLESWGAPPQRPSGRAEWYDADADTQGFGFGSGYIDDDEPLERRPSYGSNQPWSTSNNLRKSNTGSWPTPGSRSPASRTASSTKAGPPSGQGTSSNRPGPSSRPGYVGSSSGSGSGTKSQSQSHSPSSSQSSRGGGVVRTMERPQWVSPAFETNGESDFPSLGGKRDSRPSSRASQKLPMPKLAPVRKPDKPLDWNSPPVSSPQSPGPGNGSGSVPSDNNLVFDDQAIAFLEKRSSSPKVNNSSDLSFPTLRNPGQERQDNQRTLRKLPSLQSDASQDAHSFINRMRSYNMRRLTRAVWAGLDELRGHRQEIRLFARLGKVVYNGDPKICGQSWDHEELESTVIRKLGAKPRFSPIVTTESRSIENMFGFLGVPASESAEFEVICNTRTNPQSKWDPTVVIVPPTVAILERVVTPWETYAEVSWNSMDKNTDFEILLQAREGVIHDTHSALGRTDVKPFGAFRKSLSIGTHNKHISCRETPGYLKILSINYRESRKYGFEEFSVVVHHVQELDLTRTPQTNGVTAHTFRSGKAWYEIEVINEVLARHFKSNLTLTPGLTALWETKDILGDNRDNSEELSKMVKNTMLVVDQCQARFQE